MPAATGWPAPSPGGKAMATVTMSFSSLGAIKDAWSALVPCPTLATTAASIQAAYAAAINPTYKTAIVSPDKTSVTGTLTNGATLTLTGADLASTATPIRTINRI